MCQTLQLSSFSSYIDIGKAAKPRKSGITQNAGSCAKIKRDVSRIGDNDVAIPFGR